MAASALSSTFTTGVRVTGRTSGASRGRATAVTTRAAAAGTPVKTISIPATFAALKKRNQCAFIPFICAGDPNLDATEKARSGGSIGFCVSSSRITIHL